MKSRPGGTASPRPIECCFAEVEARAAISLRNADAPAAKQRSRGLLPASFVLGRIQWRADRIGRSASKVIGQVNAVRPVRKVPNSRILEMLSRLVAALRAAAALTEPDAPSRLRPWPLILGFVMPFDTICTDRLVVAKHPQHSPARKRILDLQMLPCDCWCSGITTKAYCTDAQIMLQACSKHCSKLSDKQILQYHLALVVRHGCSPVSAHRTCDLVTMMPNASMSSAISSENSQNSAGDLRDSVG
jgi:hypothetical protein